MIIYLRNVDKFSIFYNICVYIVGVIYIGVSILYEFL